MFQDRRLAQFIEDETWWTSFLEDSSWKLLGGSLEVAWRITLRLSINNLHGSIPSSLGKCQYLVELSLEQNDLSGTIPGELVSLSSLLYINMSHNELTGSLSVGVGNLKNLEQLDLSKNMLSGEIPSTIGNSFLKLSYQSLLKATDGFSPSNLIGVGLVYKGILSQGEKIVAVKVLNLQCHGASKSFFAECEALRHIKNRNLVKVLTACSSVDYHDEAHKYFRNLDLLQRLNIAIDVVSALDYLHNHCPEPIINCDLKPSNVLLDNEMTAQKPPLDSSANQSSSIGMRGSVGYAAPESRVDSHNQDCTVLVTEIELWFFDFIPRKAL
ncbi:hypothetical protein ACSBR2_017230 [Camellia fascicularis]